MQKFDLGLAYVWEYDDDFIFLLEDRLHRRNISTYRINNDNFYDAKKLLNQKKISFSFYLDRAWDVDEEFEELGKYLKKRRTRIFNPYKKVLHAIDKASMHLEFITTGINVPYSIIIPPHSEVEEIFVSVEELSILGRPFIIKPCNTTGGGLGVVTGAETLKDVLEERLTNTDDKYILQEKIQPVYLEVKREWFRCYWAFGKPIIVWWDDQTHLYEVLTNEDIKRFKLNELSRITKKIANLIQLDFFSTEIAITENRKFVVIDYVNDQCDMRLKSKHLDGVPDSVAEKIIDNLGDLIIKEKKLQKHKA